MKRIFCFFALCAAAFAASAAPKDAMPKHALPALIPSPQRIEITGPYKMPLLNVKVKIDTTLDLPAEGYVLETYKKGVRITARDERGTVWARQTLRQLTDERGLVPSVRIVDWPAFEWRGFMHDTGRNFISVEELKKHIDLLSQYKINLFHWHLTDYPAWRIESRAFPQLNDPIYQRPGRDQGKFYTYGEIRDVIAYARKKGILVIPEIDMPGHSTYFNSAFGFGMADPRGMKVLEEALDEFFEEIPVSDAPYIHIGSDEVRIPNPKEFMHWADSVVVANGRIPMVWDPGLPAASRGTIRQVWSEAPGYVANHTEGRGPFVDSYMGYLNNYDPISFTPRMLLHNPCDRAEGDSVAIGGILCLWNDTKAPGSEGIVRNSGAWSGLLPFAERFWRGGLTPEGAPENPNLFPNPESPAGRALIEFEERMLAHKNGQLRDEPFCWWPNASLEWRVSEPVPFGTGTSDLAWHTLYGGAIDVDAMIATLRLPRPDSGEVWAETILTVPHDTVILAQVGFEAPSRSNRISPGIGRQGEWEAGSGLWVNGVAVEPPVWNEPGAYAFHFNTWAKPEEELPYTDEQLFWTRQPSEIPLRAGRNVIRICSKKVFPGQHWIFAFIPR
ncbi:family 20 glycosylhydrolase [uncultured Rikenella sp.]|uniref:family 20 glycosylhydrolase n=1 Tax=uncultured Rikenella sp. TaxID=368003 RepID=UPI00262A92A2|nr:family 20 glycosylhydrolase [uncultured Rikenella sp.]